MAPKFSTVFPVGRLGWTVAASVTAVTAHQSACEQPQDAALKARIQTGANAVEKIGTEHLIAYVWGIASISIISILGLATRSAVRSDRATTAIKAAESMLLKHPAVRAAASGPIFASGSFQLRTGATLGKPVATGWFNASTGPIKGRVFMDATRQGRNGPWDIQYLRIMLDKSAVARRNAERRAQAVAAGYMTQEAADAANAAEAAEMTDSQAAAAAEVEAALGGAGSGGSMAGDIAASSAGVEHPAPGIVAIQLVGSPKDHSQELSDLLMAETQARGARAR